VYNIYLSQSLFSSIYPDVTSPMGSVWLPATKSLSGYKCIDLRLPLWHRLAAVAKDISAVNGLLLISLQ